MSVSIKELARYLNLSVSTVSKALNGYEDVAPKTRERVRQAAHDLSYHPQAAARSLRRNRTERIGIALPYRGPHSETLMELFRGVAMRSEALGYALLFHAAISDDLGALERLIFKRDIDGMILTGQAKTSQTMQMVALLKEINLPFVLLGHTMIDSDLPCVGVDYYEGTQQLMAHLLTKGHRRIAYFGRKDDAQHNEASYRAYCDALQAANINVNPAIVYDLPYHPYIGSQVMQDVLRETPREKLPSAIVAFNDHVAADAAKVVLAKGLRIPDQMAFTGFDGVALSHYFNPSITTVEQPLLEMGQAAVNILLSLFDTPFDPAKHQQLFPTTLRIGNST